MVTNIINIVGFLFSILYSGENTANIGFTFGTGTKACRIRKVSELNIVGADVNELAPMLDPSGVSTATACKVVRELLLAVAKQKQLR